MKTQITPAFITRRLNWLLLVAALLMVSSGCRQSARNVQVDQGGARQACKTALEAWQQGKKPGDLKPGIIVGDYEWNEGFKLISFEFLPDQEKEVGANLKIHVALTLEDPQGMEVKRNALYTVGTSPKVTVIRY